MTIKEVLATGTVSTAAAVTLLGGLMYGTGANGQHSLDPASVTGTRIVKVSVASRMFAMQNGRATETVSVQPGTDVKNLQVEFFSDGSNWREYNAQTKVSLTQSGRTHQCSEDRLAKYLTVNCGALKSGEPATLRLTATPAKQYLPGAYTLYFEDAGQSWLRPPLSTGKRTNFFWDVLGGQQPSVTIVESGDPLGF